MGVEKHKCDGGSAAEKCARKTVGKHECVSPSSSSAALSNSNNNSININIGSSTSGKLRKISSKDHGHGSLSVSRTERDAHTQSEREGESESATDDTPSHTHSHAHSHAHTHAHTHSNHANTQAYDAFSVEQLYSAMPTVARPPEDCSSLSPSFLAASFLSASCCAAGSSSSYHSPFARAVTTANLASSCAAAAYGDDSCCGYAYGYGSMQCAVEDCSPSPHCGTFPADFLRSPFADSLGQCSPNYDGSSCNPCGPYGHYGSQRSIFAEEQEALLALASDRVQLATFAVEGGDDDGATPAESDESMLVLTKREEPMRFENATYEDVLVDRSELQWVMITEESETPSTSTSSPSPAEELRLVLPSADGTVLHDADFGARINVVRLAEHHHPDSDQVCYLRYVNSPPIKIFWVRKQAQEAPFRPNYFVPPPASLSAGFEWFPCENDDRFIFGIKSVGKLNLRKEAVQIYDYANEKYERRFILRAETVKPYPPMTFFLDAYEPKGQLRGQRGEFVQQNSLGEIYSGRRLRVREHTATAAQANIGTQGLRHAKIHTPTEQDQEMLKLIQCISSQPVQSVEDLETALSDELSGRKENIAQEIRGMSFLRKLGERLSLPFHDYRSLLQHPGRFIAVCADYAPDRCLLQFAITQKAGEGCRLSEREAKHVMRQVCAQLAAMHAHGFAHLDISSENILLRRTHSQENGNTAVDLLTLECVLMDYGQSCAVPYCEHTQRYLPVRAKTNCPVGKATFFAPELVQKQQQGRLLNGEYDAFAVDMYQLGVTMFIMLLGYPPFNYHNSVIERERALFFRLLQQEKLHEVKIGNSSTPVSSLISTESLDLLRQLLCFHPETRPSAEDVLSHSWVQGEVEEA